MTIQDVCDRLDDIRLTLEAVQRDHEKAWAEWEEDRQCNDARMRRICNNLRELLRDAT